jgi:iron complex transport system permease protein
MPDDTAYTTDEAAVPAAPVRVRTLRRGIALTAACLAAASAVLLGGSIGFVGLVIPHLLRLCGLHEHRSLLPLSVCLGGSFLAAADALARSAAAPMELPVGAVTALIGVPVLLALIARSRA